MPMICPVCEKAIGFWQVEVGDLVVHPGCESTFVNNPEMFGGGEKTESLTEDEKKVFEQKKQRRSEQQQRIEDKSVHVKSFDMPFGDMVMFMVKWAIASIPAFIILTIIGAFIVAIFGSLFF